MYLVGGGKIGKVIDYVVVEGEYIGVVGGVECG